MVVPLVKLDLRMLNSFWYIWVIEFSSHDLLNWWMRIITFINTWLIYFTPSPPSGFGVWDLGVVRPRGWGEPSDPRRSNCGTRALVKRRSLKKKIWIFREIICFSWQSWQVSFSLRVFEFLIVFQFNAWRGSQARLRYWNYWKKFWSWYLAVWFRQCRV